MLPGKMHTWMQLGREIEELKAMLRTLRNGDGPVVTVRRGRPPKAIAAAMEAEAAAAETVIPEPVKPVRQKDSAGAGWAKFNTPAKRRAEMLRRMQVARGEAASRDKSPARKAAQDAKRKAPGKPGPKPKDKPGIPAKIGDHYTVAALAQEYGYSDTWGMTLYLRNLGIRQRLVKAEVNGAQRKVAVITQAELLKLREAKGMSKSEGKAVTEPEAMTA